MADCICEFGIGRPGISRHSDKCIAYSRKWHVFNFRGVWQTKFDTEQEAKDWIEAQVIPSEYYTDYCKYEKA